jgi:hypothetical protein
MYYIILCKVYYGITISVTIIHMNYLYLIAIRIDSHVI